MSAPEKISHGAWGRRTTLIAAVVGALAGCGPAKKSPAPPAPLVQVTDVMTEPVPNIVELPGRIEAVRSADVRARVDGIVQRRLYEEGTDVAEGAPLFQIDPREKQAQVKEAEASLQRDLATRVNAAQVVARYTPLVARKAVSAQEFDAATASLRQAEADVAQARATLDNARLQLSYTTVRAPLAGRVGRAEVTEGALVSASGATLMTHVDQLSPIYATFTQSNAKILDLMARLRSGALKAPALNRIQVRLILENGAEYGPTGLLNFADLSVDPSTGSQILRAQFPNPQRLLLPGEFVRARVLAGVTPNGVSIPQRAVAIAGGEASVMIVGADGAAASRPIELGPMVADRWIVQSGLKPGDRVIVEGWQKVRPGQKVRVEAYRGAPAAAGGASSASPPS